MTTSYGKNYFRFRSGQRFLSTKTCRWSLATDWKSCVLLSSAGPVETLWSCALWLFNVEYGWAPCTTNFSWPRVYQWCNWRSSFSSMEFCQSGTPRPHSTATHRHLQIFMGIQNLMIHVKTVALALTNGVIVEGQRKDKWSVVTTNVWFHTDCLKIVTIPTRKWCCPDCRNLAIVKKTKR